MQHDMKYKRHEFVASAILKKTVSDGAWQTVAKHLFDEHAKQSLKIWNAGIGVMQHSCTLNNMTEQKEHEISIVILHDKRRVAVALTEHIDACVDRISKGSMAEHSSPARSRR